MKIVKEKYQKLSFIELQKYIKFIKDTFERQLAQYLTLTRVSAPILVTKKSGLQDDLSGVERKVAFDLKQDGEEVEIVQSLAKWKRFALAKYGFAKHTGLYTDMTAIRRDDKMDFTHSIYVDQWDWEKVIEKKDRCMSYLKKTVRQIAQAIKKASELLKARGFEGVDICETVKFVTSEELRLLYPTLDPKEREYEITKKYKTVFIMQIGGKLGDGTIHDTRAPDYDDWSLDGDLMYYHEVLDMALEISSMGIRVDKETLLAQLKESKKEDKLEFAYHKAIVAEELPLTIGGGIGQSRLCQLLLGRIHIGEVQASYWDEKTLSLCTELEIDLL